MAGCGIELFETDGPDAVQRRLGGADTRLDELDCIVAVGGDGTLNDILNALPDPGRVPIAQLGMGTANCLARELGIPRHPAGVAKLVVGGALRRIDLATANGRRFFGNASCGFDARIVHRIAARRSGTLGMRAYVRPGFESLRGYREPQLAVHLEGGEVVRGGLVIASNLRNYGGLFTLSETAACDSGTLELVVFERARIWDLVRLPLAGALGRLQQAHGVVYRRVQRATIVSEGAESVPVQVDGDARGETPLELFLEPRAVPIVVPPDQASGRRN
jgi:diacylglycerol kinase family enzyme